MWFLYILESDNKPDKIYIGSTDDLTRRLSEHNRGHTATTRRYMPWRIVYTEYYPSKKEARDRERQLKAWKSRVRISSLIYRNKINVGL